MMYMSNLILPREYGFVFQTLLKRSSKAIIEGLDKDNSSKDSNELQTLMQCISELIEGKKFLLVLDGVLSPTRDQWEELIKHFRKGAMGSRILVTTQNKEVASLMKASTHLIHVDKLSEEFCLSLFFYSADMDEKESEVFQAIGKLIVKKCNGLPLAAKTLGSYMCDKKTNQEWLDVLDSKIWENADIKKHVFKPLSLSYNDLSPIIKRCLLYCVIFPKDYEYDRDNLIELWTSQDYLGETESLGKKYFDILVRRSFFQDIKIQSFQKTKFKIHDILHDFLQDLSEKECFTHVKPRERMVMMGNDKVRHMTIMHVSQSEHLASILRCEHLRTLTVFGSRFNSISLASILQMKCFRTLSLVNSGIEEIPNEIGGLIHLRYLDLSENPLKKIIRLSSLYNLQTLRLVHCSFLETVDLTGLTTLRHLVKFHSHKVKLIGLDQLTNLQTLDQLEAYSDVQLGVLENLNQLQGSLSLLDVGAGNSNEARKSNLLSKDHLRHLSLMFRRDESHSTESNPQQHDREILNAIHPPPRLESLEIGSYHGNTLKTDWLFSLINLTWLCISKCVYCKHLPLGKLPSLQTLHMHEVGVEKLDVEFLGIDVETPTSRFVSFPKLKVLLITSGVLKEWKGLAELSGEEDAKKKDITIMPHLFSLSLFDCQELPALPDFLWKTPLQHLHIDNCDRLRELYEGGGSENDWAKISHIPCIRFYHFGGTSVDPAAQ